MHCSLLSFLFHLALGCFTMAPFSRGLLLLLLHLLPPRTAPQPHAMLSLSSSTLPTLPPLFTLNGGRSFSTLALPPTPSMLYATSSPTGGATLIFSRDSATNLTSMHQWDSVNAQWRSINPALPSTLASITLGDISVARGAWLAGVEDSGAPSMYTWTSGGSPFFAVPINATDDAACSATLGVLNALPSASALGALADPPYSLVLWEGGVSGRGCLGSLDLLHNTSAIGNATADSPWQVFGLANSFISLTSYGLLLATGPQGCAGGASCDNASLPSLLYVANVSPSAPDATLLTPSAWASFPMPDGGGLNLVHCLDDTFLVNATYCYAMATWQPPATVYRGRCNSSSALSGYAVYAAQANSTPTLASAWRAGGCVPLLPQTFVISDFITLHVGGFDTLGGGGLSGSVLCGQRRQLAAAGSAGARAGGSGPYAALPPPEPAKNEQQGGPHAAEWHGPCQPLRCQRHQRAGSLQPRRGAGAAQLQQRAKDCNRGHGLHAARGRQHHRLPGHHCTQHGKRPRQ